MASWRKERKPQYSDIARANGCRGEVAVPIWLFFKTNQKGKIKSSWLEVDEGRRFLRGGVMSGWDPRPQGASGTSMRPRIWPEDTKRMCSTPRGGCGLLRGPLGFTSPGRYMPLADGAGRNMDASHQSPPAIAPQNLPGPQHEGANPSPACTAAQTLAVQPQGSAQAVGGPAGCQLSAIPREMLWVQS